MENVYLEHHGIKGQKWGVRRYQNKDGTLTAQGRNRKTSDDIESLVKKYTDDVGIKGNSRYSEQVRKLVKEYGDYDPSLDKDNANKIKTTETKMKDLQSKIKDIDDKRETIYNDYLDKKYTGKNPSEAAMKEKMNKMYQDKKKLEDTYKAESYRLRFLKGELQRPDELTVNEYSSRDYLEHRGIKGQKWGRRRYQNPDGSLTPLGRQHYGVGSETPLLEGPTVTALSTAVSRGSSKSSTSSSSKKNDFIEGEWRWADDPPSGGKSKHRFSGKTKVDDVMDGEWRKVEQNVKKKARKTKVDDMMGGKWKKVKESEKKNEDPDAAAKEAKAKFEKYQNISSALGAGSKMAGSLKSSQERKLQRDKQKVMDAMDLSKFSDSDLKNAISRMSTEQTYKKMVADRVDYGRQKTIRRLETIGSIAATASSAVGLYAAIKKVRS